MASTYTPLGVELQATGENAGTWGTKTNTNLQILEQISGGFTQKSIAGGAQTTALTVSDGSTGAELAHRMIEFTFLPDLTNTTEESLSFGISLYKIHPSSYNQSDTLLDNLDRRAAFFGNLPRITALSLWSN